MNRNRILFGMLFTLAFVSCEDALEVTDPGAVTSTTALQSDKNVKLVLTGAYDALSTADIFGGDVLRNSELLAANGEILFSGTFADASEIFTKQTVTSNANVKDFWVSAYKAINLANNVIGALGVVKEEDRAWVEGEALFVRGITYFELVKFFGKPYSAGNVSVNAGVPIVLAPALGFDERDKASRNSVGAVYTQVVTDLTRAVTLLSDKQNNATRATRESALAVLSRVYLQMEDYEKARDAADAVIGSNKFELNTDIATSFNTGTTDEDIFNIPVTATDGTNRMQWFFASTTFGGRGDIRILQKHLDLYEEGDARLGLFYTDAANGFTRTGKWTNRFGNVKVIRLAEMYLTRAEANLRLGTAAGAEPVDDVNEIRGRVGLGDLETVSLDDILKERRLELAHEGQRLHDVKRLKQSVVEGETTYPYNDNLLVFPIPQRERNLNGNLSQNDGYF